MIAYVSTVPCSTLRTHARTHVLEERRRHRLRKRIWREFMWW